MMLNCIHIELSYIEQGVGPLESGFGMVKTLI